MVYFTFTKKKNSFFFSIESLQCFWSKFVLLEAQNLFWLLINCFINLSMVSVICRTCVFQLIVLISISVLSISPDVMLNTFQIPSHAINILSISCELHPRLTKNYFLRFMSFLYLTEMTEQNMERKKQNPSLWCPLFF